MDDRLIIFRNATVCNGETPVIYGLDMEVMPGDFVYITGKVGSGKTSIIRSVIAENPLYSGYAKVCGFDLVHMRNRDIPMLRRRLGVVFQDFQLLMERSVYDNLDFVLRCTGWKDNMAMHKRIMESLKAVGLEKKAHKMPFQLSGGEQQRTAIARALLNNPELILADEPTGNLDAVTADGIMQLLTSINKDKGTAVVMVTHNTSLCERYPGRVFVCEGEHCVEQAPQV